MHYVSVAFFWLAFLAFDAFDGMLLLIHLILYSVVPDERQACQPVINWNPWKRMLLVRILSTVHNNPSLVILLKVAAFYERFRQQDGADFTCGSSPAENETVNQTD